MVKTAGLDELLGEDDTAVTILDHELSEYHSHLLKWTRTISQFYMPIYKSVTFLSNFHGLDLYQIKNTAIYKVKDEHIYREYADPPYDDASYKFKRLRRKHNELATMFDKNYYDSVTINNQNITGHNPIKYFIWRKWKIAPTTSPATADHLFCVHTDNRSGIDYYNDKQMLADLFDAAILLRKCVFTSFDIGSIPELAHWHIFDTLPPIARYVRGLDLLRQNVLFNDDRVAFYKIVSREYALYTFYYFKITLSYVHKFAHDLYNILRQSRFTESARYFPQCVVFPHDDSEFIECALMFRSTTTSEIINGAPNQQFYDELFGGTYGNLRPIDIAIGACGTIGFKSAYPQDIEKFIEEYVHSTNRIFHFNNTFEHAFVEIYSYKSLASSVRYKRKIVREISNICAIVIYKDIICSEFTFSSFEDAKNYASDTTLQIFGPVDDKYYLLDARVFFNTIPRELAEHAAYYTNMANSSMYGVLWQLVYTDARGYSLSPDNCYLYAVDMEQAPLILKRSNWDRLSIPWDKHYNVRVAIGPKQGGENLDAVFSFLNYGFDINRPGYLSAGKYEFTGYYALDERLKKYNLSLDQLHSLAGAAAAKITAAINKFPIINVDPMTMFASGNDLRKISNKSQMVEFVDMRVPPPTRFFTSGYKFGPSSSDFDKIKDGFSISFAPRYVGRPETFDRIVLYKPRRNLRFAKLGFERASKQIFFQQIISCVTDVKIESNPDDVTLAEEVANFICESAAIPVDGYITVDYPGNTYWNNEARLNDQSKIGDRDNGVEYVIYDPQKLLRCIGVYYNNHTVNKHVFYTHVSNYNNDIEDLRRSCKNIRLKASYVDIYNTRISALEYIQAHILPQYQLLDFYSIKFKIISKIELKQTWLGWQHNMM